MILHTRREILMGAGALLAGHAWAAASPRFAGIFPIMNTPFTNADALDLETLVREAEFLHRAGVQGVVWPQLASEWSTLSFEERMAGAEALVPAVKALDAATRPAVIIGVQAPDTPTAVKYARFAEKLQPDAIIAIPLNGGKGDSEQVAYYRAIGEACSRPLFVQTIGEMSVDLVVRMAKQIPTLRYVKDEAGVTLARLTEYRQRAREITVFTGAHGKNFVDELRRGAVGNMPAPGFAELYVATWKQFEMGHEDQAMEMYGKQLIAAATGTAYGMPGMKYVLQLRGVFRNTKCRGPAGKAFDAEAQEAIRDAVDYAHRWFTA